MIFSLIQLVLPVLQVVLVQGQLDGGAVLVGKADADYLSLADGSEAVRRELCKKLVGVLEGGLVVVKGDGIAGRCLPDAGLHVKDIIIADQQQGRLQPVTGKAVVQDGQVGGGNHALFVHVCLEVNIAVGGEAVGSAVVNHIGIAVAEAAKHDQHYPKEDDELIFHILIPFIFRLFSLFYLSLF